MSEHLIREKSEDKNLHSNRAVTKMERQTSSPGNMGNGNLQIKDPPPEDVVVPSGKVMPSKSAQKNQHVPGNQKSTSQLTVTSEQAKDKRTTEKLVTSKTASDESLQSESVSSSCGDGVGGDTNGQCLSPVAMALSENDGGENLYGLMAGNQGRPDNGEVKVGRRQAPAVGKVGKSKTKSTEKTKVKNVRLPIQHQKSVPGPKKKNTRPTTARSMSSEVGAASNWNEMDMLYLKRVAKEYYDVLLLFSEKDNVDCLRKLLKKGNFKYKESFQPGRSIFANLVEDLNCCSLIMVFLTANFIQDYKLTKLGDTSVIKSLEDADKLESVIPIICGLEDSEIPTAFKSLTPLNTENRFFEKTFSSTIEKSKWKRCKREEDNLKEVERAEEEMEQKKADSEIEQLEKRLAHLKAIKEKEKKTRSLERRIREYEAESAGICVEEEQFYEDNVDDDGGGGGENYDGDSISGNGDDDGDGDDDDDDEDEDDDDEDDYDEEEEDKEEEEEEGSEVGTDVDSPAQGIGVSSGDTGSVDEGNIGNHGNNGDGTGEESDDNDSQNREGDDQGMSKDSSTMVHDENLQEEVEEGKLASAKSGTTEMENSLRGVNGNETQKNKNLSDVNSRRQAGGKLVSSGNGAGSQHYRTWPHDAASSRPSSNDSGRSSMQTLPCNDRYSNSEVSSQSQDVNSQKNTPHSTTPSQGPAPTKQQFHDIHHGDVDSFGQNEKTTEDEPDDNDSVGSTLLKKVYGPPEENDIVPGGQDAPVPPGEEKNNGVSQDPNKDEGDQVKEKSKNKTSVKKKSKDKKPKRWRMPSFRRKKKSKRDTSDDDSPTERGGTNSVCEEPNDVVEVSEKKGHKHKKKSGIIRLLPSGPKRKSKASKHPAGDDRVQSSQTASPRTEETNGTCEDPDKIQQLPDNEEHETEKKCEKKKSKLQKIFSFRKKKKTNPSHGL